METVVVGAEGIMADEFVRQYIALQGARFEKHRRSYALIKVLEIFLRNSSFSSVSDAVRYYSENPKNGLAIALQKTINELQGQGLKPKSIIFYIHLLKKFLEYYDVPVNLVWSKLSKPRKVTSRVDRLPSLGELQQLIMAPKSARLRLLIQLLCQTGMRIGEALNLRIDYIDFENNVIRIPATITKTGVSREVPLIKELREAIVKYLQTRKINSPYLFPSLRDPSRPWSIFKARSAYIKLLRRLGMGDRTPDGTSYRLHFHVFRKWFRTVLETAGVNKLLIDLWMGHNSGIEKTYYIPSTETIRHEVDKAEKALQIFGAIPQALAEEKMKAIEDRLNALEKIYRRDLVVSLLCQEASLLHVLFKMLTPEELAKLQRRQIGLEDVLSKGEKRKAIKKRLKEIRRKLDEYREYFSPSEWKEIEREAEMREDEYTKNL